MSDQREWWTVRLPSGPGPGLTAAVKDVIDVAGWPTTAGSRAVEATAKPAAFDADVVAALREGGVQIIAKSTLNEIAFGLDGRNPEFGTPVNPADPSRVPGGSSSGSAVAVASGDVDLALGTDTGGSIRVPAACCGIAGLKTSWGRLSMRGVQGLAPSMDTVGPLGRDVEAIAAAMELLAPGFEGRMPAKVQTVGRLRTDRRPGETGPDTDPAIDAAIDETLARCGVQVIDIDVPTWTATAHAALTVLFIETARSCGHLLERRSELLAATAARLELAIAVDPALETEARSMGLAFASTLEKWLREVDVIVTPVLTAAPPLVSSDLVPNGHFTRPINLAGLPALSMPVGEPRRPGAIPVAMQIISAMNHDETTLVLGRQIEANLA